MKRGGLRILDTTLRDGDQSPLGGFTGEEKLAIARALSDAGVDVIEAGFPASGKTDFDACALVARASRDFQGNPAINRNEGIDDLFQGLQTVVRIALPNAPLDVERLGHDGNRQRPGILARLRGDGRPARPRSTAQSRGDENHIASVHGGAKLVQILLGRLGADFRIATGPEALGQITQIATNGQEAVGLGEFRGGKDQSKMPPADKNFCRRR